MRDRVLFVFWYVVSFMGRLKKKWFGKKKLNEQLRVFFTVMITILVVLMLAVSTFSAVRSSYRKSEEQAIAQVNFMASSYHTWLTGANDLIVSLEMDTATQEFCGYTETSGLEYEKRYLALYNFLNNYLYVNSDVNFIAVFNENTGKYGFCGKQSLSTTGVGTVYDEDYAESYRAKAKGTLKVNYGNRYYEGERYTVTFYQPVYSVMALDEQIGVACINMNDSMIMNMKESGTVELCMTDLDGKLIATSDKDRMGSGEQVLDFGGKEEGTANRDGKCYFFKRIPEWNYYVVSIMPLSALYRSSIQAAILILIIAVILLLVSLFIMRRMIDKSYSPLQRVVDAMDRVSDKRLDFRIETEDMGEDFEKLGVGFNGMMDDIQKLMVDVRDEQRQTDQIRLNALQSQIQPHFLYNTLDCIHWQARADGNKETSELVMALARYYRICLSRGKDVIPLRQELEHVRYYLVIQNKRYGDIINYNMRVEDIYMDVKIPKLTLQPLIENSIYHGIRIKEGCSGTVSITAEKTEQGILLKVEDSGKGMEKEQVEEMNNSISNYDEDFGYGVRNVNRRIELLFGKGYGLHYCINENGGVTVEILLPEEYDDEVDSIFGGSHV